MDYVEIWHDKKNKVAEIIKGKIILHLGSKICGISLSGKEIMRI